MKETYYDFCSGKQETAVSQVDISDTAHMCSTERRWISKMLKYAQAYPQDVQVIHRPEDNDGM